MKLGMIYTTLGSFCSFLNWEGADIRPQIRPRKTPGLNSHISEKMEHIDKFSCRKSISLSWVTWVNVFRIIPEFRISIKSQP